MYCESCGAMNSDTSLNCASCGAPLAGGLPYGTDFEGTQQSDGADRQVEVPDYLVRAIIVTILLFFPFGIPAIVNAVEARTAAEQGDFDGALALSERSKMWSNVAIGVGIPFQVLVSIFYFVYYFNQLGGF